MSDENGKFVQVQFAGCWCKVELFNSDARPSDWRERADKAWPPFVIMHRLDGDHDSETGEFPPDYMVMTGRILDQLVGDDELVEVVDGPTPQCAVSSVETRCIETFNKLAGLLGQRPFDYETAVKAGDASEGDEHGPRE